MPLTPRCQRMAPILADVCDAVLAARRMGGVLAANQTNLADQCEILVRALARVGIIALVDEATGYQRDREKDALAKILEAWISKELAAWVKTFPTDSTNKCSACASWNSRRSQSGVRGTLVCSPTMTGKVCRLFLPAAGSGLLRDL
jgi:hypothetical protein